MSNRNGGKIHDAEGFERQQVQQAQLMSMIIREFQLPADCSGAALLVDDLQFDSLKLIELVAYIEDAAGIQIGKGPIEYPVLSTLNDAVEYFTELRLQSEGEGAP